MILVPNGSPFEDGKFDRRLNLIVARVTESGLPMAYLNQIGGQDELVSTAPPTVPAPTAPWPIKCRPGANRCGSPIGRAGLVVGPSPSVNAGRSIRTWRRSTRRWFWVYAIMFVKRLSGVLLGLSGGIDSAQRGRCGGCLGRRASPLCDDAVALHQQEAWMTRRRRRICLAYVWTISTSARRLARSIRC